MHPNSTPPHEFASSYAVKHPHRAKICLSVWIYPGMGYVIHFLTPTAAYRLAYNIYAFFIMTWFKKIFGVPPSGSGPAYIDLIFIVAVTQWNPMGAAQIIS